jgi:hypothetical protein
MNNLSSLSQKPCRSRQPSGCPAIFRSESIEKGLNNQEAICASKTPNHHGNFVDKRGKMDISTQISVRNTAIVPRNSMKNRGVLYVWTEYHGKGEKGH